MLKELYIENLAIIEKAVITFGPAFNVFSGETGAGKSILIGGINAVLGGRVSKEIVRAGATKAIVTALFDNLPEKTAELLSEYGYDGELTLTREISCTGNSTARVNGRTATASVLREIASGLIDVHGQHETRLITSQGVQLQLLDGFGQISSDEYVKAFREFSAVSKRIKQLKQEHGLKEEKSAILTARIADLEPYKLKVGEEEEVSRELNRLQHIQTLSESLNCAFFALNGFSGSSSESGALDLLNLCKSNLSIAADLLPECRTLCERLVSVSIELDDIKREISPLISENDSFNSSGKLLSHQERMSDFLRLRRKYGLSIDELIEKQDEWKSELSELQCGDETLQKLNDEKKRSGDLVKRLAEELTHKRKQAALELCRLICAELEYLDMPGIRIVFDIKQEKVTVSGMDSVEMLISVNKGEEPKPLAKIASGGELSRIMLAIKSVLAQNDDVSTMVFDEIDSGISGRAAYKVGLKMSELSRKKQVLCVTHLAQIAAMADEHLLIEKHSRNDRTYTNVRCISGEERKHELARIISGDDDEISLANAERLISKTTAQNSSYNR